MGDFNLHVDDGDNLQAGAFVDILESYNLRQHVTGASHISDHTIHFAITKSNDTFLSAISIFDPVISDQYQFLGNCAPTPPLIQQVIMS